MFNTAQQHKNQGNDFYRKKLFTQAIQEYTKAIQIQEEPIFYSNRSSCYFALSNFVKAKQDAEKAFQLNSQFDKAYYKAGKACKKLGEFQLAAQYFNKGFELSQDPTMRQEMDDTNLLAKYLIQIEEHIQKNEYKDALRKINNILEQIEPQISFIHKKIEILCIQGELEKAQQYLNKMEIFIKKQQQEIYYYLKGLINENQHNRQEAKENYQIGLRKNPDLILLQRKLKKLISIDKQKEEANQLFKKGNYNQALQVYQKILNQIQNNLKFEAIICSNISSCYKKLNKKTKALEFIKKSIQLNPKYDTAFYRKGQIEKEMKNYEDAEQSFRQAQGFNPKLNLQKLIKECQVQNKKNNIHDFYKILGVEKNATQDQIKKQYKKLALKFHPDRNNDSQEQKQEAEKKFKQISEAYDTLGDPEKRKKHDMGFNNNSNEFQDYQNGQNNGFQNFDFGNSHNGFKNFTFSSSNGQEIDPSIFQMFFGKGSSNNFNFMNEGGFPSSKARQNFQFFN